MATFNVWVMTNEVDVFGANGIYITFAKNPHGFLEGVIKTNVVEGSDLFKNMKAKAENYLEFYNERLASR